VGYLGRGDPDLLATDNIAITFPLRLGLDLCRVEANVRLGDCETSLLLAPDERRQHARLLLRRAEDDDRLQPENVHVDRRGASHACSAFRDRPQHHCSFCDAETRSAILVRHGNPKQAGIGDSSVEVLRERALKVLLQPIIVVETRAELLDETANLLLIVRKREVHRCPH
jgi:hypothetical protein